MMHSRHLRNKFDFLRKIRHSGENKPEVAAAPLASHDPGDYVKKRLIRWSVATAAMTAVVSTIGLLMWHKSVTVIIDGEPQRVSGFLSTVSDALSASGISVGPRDSVTPNPDDVVAEGTRIDVRFGRPLEVKVEGRSTLFWTTETTIPAALRHINVPIAEGAQLYENVARPLSREGMTINITTPKKVTAVIAGISSTVHTSAPTVGHLLDEEKIQLGPYDHLKPSRDTVLTTGMTVTLDRIAVQERSRTEPVPFRTVTEEDPSLDAETTRVATEGQPGIRTIIEQVTVVNGRVESTSISSSSVTKAPVHAVIKIGTKTPSEPSSQTPSPSTTKRAERNSTPSPEESGSAQPSESRVGLDLSHESMWDRIAKCESGGHWNMNSGNGYYGGLQFHPKAWLGHGGTDFAIRPDYATREQQITVANRIFARHGLQPWNCRHVA